MVATSCFNKHSRVCLSIGLYLLFIFSVADTRAQTATYHLHREASSTANLFQLKTNAPDAASLAIQSANLKNKAVGEYLIKAFDTQSGVPGASGTITAGSTVTFSLWLKRTGTGGTLFPRAKLNLNSAAGTSIAIVTGTTALTTTLTKYTLSGTVPANVSITASDRIYLWVGINLTASPNTNSVGELDIEGTLNGNYDSTVTVPLPSALPPPSISSLTPNSGTTGTSVNVAGVNFGATQGTSTITFNGIVATPTSWSDTSIVTTVPAGANTGSVVVTVAGQASNSVTFTVNAPPPGDVEYFYDEVGRLVGVVTPAERVTYTYDAVGNLLSISRGNSAQVSIVEFTPNGGPIGTAVTIYGTGFSTTANQNTVTFNGVAANVTSATATRIVTSVPAGATTGPISVTSPAGSATSSTAFVVSASAAPTITGFTPTIGTAGTAVAVTGTNFEPNNFNNKLSFNQTFAAVTSATTTSIATSVPAGTASGRITVTTPQGTGVSADDFFIPPSPYTAADVEVTGRMVFGESRVVTINTPNKVALIVFDGVAGQWVSLGMSNTNIGATGCCVTSTVTIYKPDGTTLLAPYQFYQGGGGTPSVQLPVTATYTILVDPYSTVVGSVTLTLSEDLSPPISINGPAVTLTNRAGQNARLSFSGTAGQRVSLGLTDVTIGAPNCCLTSKVAIYKPDGTALYGPNDLYGPLGTPSLLLPASGTYTIVVDPYNAVAGNVTLTLSEDLSPPISINGPAVTLTNRAGQNARLVFSGNAGQWISLGVSDVTIAATSCCTSSTVAIYKPDGTPLLSPTTIQQTGVTTQSFQLPVSGSYVIVVDPYDAVAGNATLTLSEDLSPAISINGPAVVLQFNRWGQNSRLLFSGTAGQWVSVGTTNSTISASGCCASSTVALYKPDGTTLLAPLTFFQGGGGTPSVQLPVSGTYAMVVEPYNNMTGSVTLTLSEDLSPPISINGPAVTLTNREGQNARLSFSGTAGQWVSLGLTDVTIGAPGCCVTSKVAVYKPDGTSLYGPNDFYGPLGTPSLLLPASGTYTIVVDPYNAVAGNVTLTLSEDLSPPITINGPAVTLTNRAGQNARLVFSGTAGQWISLGVSDVTIAATSCCTSSTVAIYKPDGTPLLSPTTIQQTGVTTQSFQLPVNGSYVIVVDPYDAVAGNATLTLSEDLSPAISINGPAVVLQFNRWGQNSRLLFSGTAGQWVSVGTTNSTISASGCCASSTVALYKPDGTTLLAPLTFFQGGGGTPSVQLPVSGTYAMVVEPYNNMTGSVTLTLSEDLSPPISINGPAVPMTNRAGQNARLFFSGNAGQWVSVGISDTTIGATGCCVTSTVALYKPDGTTLLAPFQFYSPGNGTPSVQLPTTGTYAIVVDAYDATAGNFTVTLSEDLSPPISINGPAVTLTNRAGQNARLFFSGTAGQRVSLGLSNVTIGAPGCCVTSKVAIYKPDGTSLYGPNDFYGPLTTPFLTLPASGTYTIIIDPYNAVAGNVTLTLSEESPPDELLTSIISVTSPLPVGKDK